MTTLSVALGGTNPRAAKASDDAKPSVTVFPVVTTPNIFSFELAKRVGILVATLLERAGLEDLEVADTLFNPPETICDRSGDWVLIDMHNSHHPDFERIDPKSAADCNRLLLARLNDWLSE